MANVPIAKLKVPRGPGERPIIHFDLFELAGTPDGLAEPLVAALRDVTKLRGEVLCVAPGSLPNDGKVIEDARSYK